jgi:hypothetical protein
VQLVSALLLVSHVPSAGGRLALVALHVGAGALLVVGALLRALREGAAGAGPRPAGPLLVLASGAAVLLFGATRDYALLVAAHAALAVALAARSLPLSGAARVLPVAVAASLAFASFARTSEREPAREPVVTAGALLPDRAGGFVDASALEGAAGARFVDVTRCAGCHDDVVAAHESSAHRHASVTDPLYLLALRDLVEARGDEAARFCAGCHDHGLLALGLLDEGIARGPDIAQENTHADVGIGCLSCHGASSLRSSRGNGAWQLALPDDPLVTADGARLALARLLVRVDPRDHRAAMRDGATASSARCGACHRSSLHPAINGQAHMRGQTERDAHRASAFFRASGASGRLPLDVGERSCVDCHMDPSSGGHATAMANTLLPAARGDEAHEARVLERLVPGEGAPPWSLSWLVVDDAGVRPSDGTLPASGELHLLITNEGVAHRFPGGTTDTHDLRVVVDVLDGGGELLHTDDEHALGARLLDEGGEDERHHRVHRLHTPLFDHTLAPGGAHIVRYRASGAKAGAKLRARLRWRKLSADVAADALATAGVSPRPLPVATLGETSPRFALAPALRLSRYADAAGAAWDDERARAALAQAARSDAGDIEVKLARARFLHSREHARAEAAALLEGETDARAVFLRARALLDGGRPDDARGLLEELARDFRNDAEVWRALALSRRRTGDLEAAATANRRVLDLVPGDFAALRFHSALAGERGDAEAARRWREEAERVRQDRDATLAAVQRERRDAWAAREADRAHVHVLELGD